MPQNKYLDVSLSDDDIANEAYKAHLGGGAETWEERGAFQLALMKHLGLKPEHRLVDYGCGPIRAGRYFIRYLNAGHYHGFDVNADFIRAAETIVGDTPDLAAKAPALTHAPEFLENIPAFDALLFFSVLNFVGNREKRKVLKLARSMPKDAVIWITHGRWIERMSEEDKAGIEITRLTGDDLPADLGAEANGWEPDNRMIPILELRPSAAG